MEPQAVNPPHQYAVQLAGLMERPPLSYDFLVKHACEFTLAEHPLNGTMQMKRCFMNALHLARKEGFYYVEGLACTPDFLFPLSHAWCLTPDGTVIDPTWKHVGSQYFGAVMDVEMVERFMWHTAHYGVLDNLYLLRKPLKEIAGILRGLLLKKKD